MVRPVPLYGSKTWVTKKRHLRRLEAIELWYFEGYVRKVTLLVHMQNYVIRRETKVSRGSELRERRLRWNGHVQRMDTGNDVKEAFEIRVCMWRMKRQPRKLCRDCVQENGVHIARVLVQQALKRLIWQLDPC